MEGMQTLAPKLTKAELERVLFEGLLHGGVIDQPEDAPASSAEEAGRRFAEILSGADAAQVLQGQAEIRKGIEYRLAG